MWLQGSLEYLDTLAFTLGDAVMDLHVVAYMKLRDVLLLLLLFNCTDDIHFISFYKYRCHKTVLDAIR